MIDSASGDVTAPVWAADLTIPSPAPNTSDSGCQAADFAGMPAGRDRAAPARHLRRADEVPQRAGRGRRRDRLHQRGQPRRSRDRDGPALVQPDRRRHHRPDGRRADRDRRRTSPAASRQGLVGKTVRAARRVPRRRDPDAERHRRDARRRPEQGRSWSARTSTASAPARASTTTAPARPRSSRSPSSCAACSRRTRSASSGSAPRSPACSARRPTSTACRRASARKIAAMLNFDMIGSPNFVNFVYDGDLSDSPPIPEDVFAPEARPFSATIEKIFLDYFKSPADPERADGLRRPLGLRAVHRRGHPRRRPVHRRRGLKTPEQAAIFGGTAG